MPLDDGFKATPPLEIPEPPVIITLPPEPLEVLCPFILNGFVEPEEIAWVINGVLLLGLAAILLYSSIESLLNGGRLIEVEVVTGYLLFCTLFCSALWLIIKSYYKKVKSEIILAESVNWMIDALISTVVFITFGISCFLKGTKYEFIIPYINSYVNV